MVKQGYKQTEVGVIPEDWSVVLLDSLAKRGSGHTPNKKHPEYWNGDIKWISLRDSEFLKAIYIHETVAKISQKGLENSSAVLHPKGTVVLSRDAGVGKSTIMAEQMAVSQHFMAWQCGPNLSNLYLYYWLQATKPEFERIAIGSTIKTIGLPYFASLSIPLPTLLEQQAIAAVLSDIDALIVGLDKLIAKKRAIKTATMQVLLTGEKRLPGFGEGKGNKQSENGRIPEDWNVVNLNEIGQSLIGLTYKPENIREHGTLVLRSSNIQNNSLAFSDNVYVEMELPQRVIVQKDDILICVRNGSRQLIGKCALIDETTAGSAFGAFMSVFRTDHSKFVFYQFQSNIIQGQINEIMGATINQITNKDMASFTIPLPTDQAEEKAIALIIEDMDNEITALENRRAKTNALKQGMMQELLTGRIRLL